MSGQQIEGIPTVGTQRRVRDTCGRVYARSVVTGWNPLMPENAATSVSGYQPRNAWAPQGCEWYVTPQPVRMTVESVT